MTFVKEVFFQLIKQQELSEKRKIFCFTTHEWWASMGTTTTVMYIWNTVHCFYRNSISIYIYVNVHSLTVSQQETMLVYQCGFCTCPAAETSINTLLYLRVRWTLEETWQSTILEVISISAQHRESCPTLLSSLSRRLTHSSTVWIMSMYKKHQKYWPHYCVLETHPNRQQCD